MLLSESKVWYDSQVVSEVRLLGVEMVDPQKAHTMYGAYLSDVLNLGLPGIRVLIGDAAWSRSAKRDAT